MFEVQAAVSIKNGSIKDKAVFFMWFSPKNKIHVDFILVNIIVNLDN